MTTIRRLNCVSSGWIILPIESRMSSNAISTMSIATISPDRYSILPCPNGCPGSGFCPAMRNPVSVISEEPASERLLNASAVIAIE